MNEIGSIQTQTGTGQLVEDFPGTNPDTEGLVSETGSPLGQESSPIRERLTHGLESAKACWQDFEEKAVAGAKATDRVVHEHPYPMLGLAFGFGLVFGYLFSRRS